MDDLLDMGDFDSDNYGEDITGLNASPPQLQQQYVHNNNNQMHHESPQQQQ